VTLFIQCQAKNFKHTEELQKLKEIFEAYNQDLMLYKLYKRQLVMMKLKSMMKTLKVARKPTAGKPQHKKDIFQFIMTV